MILTVIDLETYYDKDFSLSKMQTDAYCLDPRFETIGVGAQLGDAAPVWKSGDDDFLRKNLGGAKWWEDKAIICHNALFDAFILTQRYGIKPKLWIDTLAMGRALYPWLPSHSLANLALYLGVGTKGTEVQDALGKRRKDFTPEELARYGEYCKNDVTITRKMYDIMAPQFPALEFALVDMTVRMFVEPALQLNKDKLVSYREQIIADKEALLSGASISKDVIMSNPMFAEELIKRGVVPPTKVSKTTGKEAYAFAKTDEGLTDLLDHEDSTVQALVAARLGNKTTIAETRAQKLVETAERGIGFPVYLNYWGAKTTGRFSGGNKINCLVGETEITVLREGVILCIMLSALLPTDLVWDGEEFVTHGGLIHQGEKEVLTHDNITGTKEHKVFIAGREEPVELGIAKEQGLVLQIGSSPKGMG